MLIALLESGTSGLREISILPATGAPAGFDGVLTALQIALKVAAPDLWLGLVHVIAQFT